MKPSGLEVEVHQHILWSRMGRANPADKNRKLHGEKVPHFFLESRNDSFMFGNLSCLLIFMYSTHILLYKSYVYKINKDWEIFL